MGAILFLSIKLHLSRPAVLAFDVTRIGTKLGMVLSMNNTIHFQIALVQLSWLLFNGLILGLELGIFSAVLAMTNTQFFNY